MFKVDSPVREEVVTKKVLVPGTYGNISVSPSHSDFGNGVHVAWTHGKDNIKETIKTLQQIVEAME